MEINDSRPVASYRGWSWNETQLIIYTQQFSLICFIRIVIHMKLYEIRVHKIT